MKLKANRFYCNRILVLVAILLLSASNVSAAVPQIINYQGTLSDSGGTPINATLNITFTLYDADVAGTNLWQETQSVDVANGVFNVQFGADVGNPLAPSIFEDPLFLGVQVDADPEMIPRQALASVGYAFRAKSVENDTLNSLTCGNGEVPKWNGSDWACSTDADSGGDITGVTTGTGLTGGGASGNVNIAADTAYLQRRVLSLCAPGQSIRVINANGSVICEVDTDTDTTYSAGSGLQLSGTTFSIPTNGIFTSLINDGAVTEEKIAINSISSGKIQANSITGSKIQNGTLTGLDIAQTNTLVAGHLASGSVGQSEIATNGVGTTEIVNGSVNSLDLNDNAKGIGVNGSIIIQSTEFRPMTDGADFSYQPTGYVRPGISTAAICLQAPVALPDGVTVTRFEISVIDNSVNNMSFTLRKIDFNTGSSTNMGTAVSGGTSASVRVFADTTIVSGTVDGFAHSFLIHGCIVGDSVGALNQRLYAARIRYN